VLVPKELHFVRKLRVDVAIYGTERAPQRSVDLAFAWIIVLRLNLELPAPTSPGPLGGGAKERPTHSSPAERGLDSQIPQNRQSCRLSIILLSLNRAQPSQLFYCPTTPRCAEEISLTERSTMGRAS
jgi:hypothetical protein